MTSRITEGVGANLLGQHSTERNQDATVYIGNLDPKVTEELLWELLAKAGPVVNVYLPKDRVSDQHHGYGFVEFRSEEYSDNAIKYLNMLRLFGKPIRVNKASQDKAKKIDVGANLFVGNLDPDLVDERLLYDTFSTFGVIIANPKVMRESRNLNRGYGFISYDSFEASDAAIESMDGQYLCFRPISVSYAYKKGTKGERHGTPAERQLAANNSNTQKNRTEPQPMPVPSTAPHRPPRAVMGIYGSQIPQAHYIPPPQPQHALNGRYGGQLPQAHYIPPPQPQHALNGRYGGQLPQAQSIPPPQPLHEAFMGKYGGQLPQAQNIYPSQPQQEFMGMYGCQIQGQSIPPPQPQQALVGSYGVQHPHTTWYQ